MIKIEDYNNRIHVIEIPSKLYEDALWEKNDSGDHNWYVHRCKHGKLPAHYKLWAYYEAAIRDPKLISAQRLHPRMRTSKINNFV